MKKLLPIIILVVGVLVLAGVFYVIKGKKGASPSDEEGLLELPIEKRPVVSLIPASDGHYLKLIVDKIVIDAKSLEYMLNYDVPGGVPQGVPGTVELNGEKSYENDLLLGSESSGKFRYDEGVENGSITLRFRNGEGKLLAKLTTGFHLQSNTDNLTSSDGAFSYKLQESVNAYFVTLNTLGYPGEINFTLKKGPYGVFSSTDEKIVGEIIMDSNTLYYYDDDWVKLEDHKSKNIGIFASD